MTTSSIERNAKLKSLKSQLAEMRGQHQAATTRVMEAQKALTTAERSVNALVGEIGRLEQEAMDREEHVVTVSDHAVLRWLERRHNLNIDAIRDEILDDGAKSKIKFIVSGKVEKQGLTLVVKDRNVITITPQRKGSITL